MSGESAGEVEQLVLCEVARAQRGELVLPRERSPEGPTDADLAALAAAGWGVPDARGFVVDPVSRTRRTWRRALKIAAKDLTRGERSEVSRG